MDILRIGVGNLPVTDEGRRDVVEAALVFRRFALEHPGLFSIAFHRVDPAVWPRFRTAASDALAILFDRFEALAEQGLLAERSIREAVFQFDALTEGLAAVELRGVWLEVDAERMWRDAVSALLVGLSEPAPDESPHGASEP